MDSTDRELLVIVRADPAADVVDLLTREFVVIHTVSPRVVVIRNPGHGDDGDLGSMADVTVVRGADIPSEAMVGLDQAEALFVQAWATRNDDAKRVRELEGLDWDTGGFEPPDPPPDHGFGFR